MTTQVPTNDEAREMERPFTSKRIGRRGTDACAFCGHGLALHQGNESHKTGCSATVCEDKASNRGRCAVYMSQERADKNDRWFKAFEEPHTTTPRALATLVHQMRFNTDEPHSLIHSCACAHVAMGFLGEEQ